MAAHDRRIRRCLAVAAALALTVGACTPEERAEIRDEVGQAASEAEREVRDAVSEAEQAQESVEPSEPAPETEPEPETEEPAPSPTPEEAESPDTDETTDSTDWLPIILALLALLVVIALIAGAVSRRRDRRRVAHDRVRAALVDLLGTGRWVLDQGSIEVQRVTDPQQLQRSWQMVRERLVGIEEQVAALLVDVEGEPVANALRNLAVSSEALRSGLDGTVSLRSGPDPDPDLVSDNRLAVQQRRRDFGAALDRIATFR